MSITWTDEQREVIEQRDCDILVSAAAGSGKTAVLVERILSRLMDPVRPLDIDHFLIVTFTNAAAGEMKERIREALETKLEQEELSSEMEEHLSRQTMLLQNAQITTIHSFCQHVIRSYFQTVDLDPDFRIMDDGEKKLLQSDVLEQLLEDNYLQADPAFLEMTESYCAGRDDKGLEKLIMQLYEFSMSAPWPREWMEQCAAAYEVSDPQSLSERAWVRRIFEMADALLQEAAGQAARAVSICQEADGPAPYLEAVEADLEMLEQLSGCPDFAALGRAFETLASWKRLSNKKSPGTAEEKKEEVKRLREAYKKTVTDLQNDYFYAPVEKIAEEMQKAAPALRELVRVTGQFMERYAEEKRRKNYMDFDDLEHFALRILIRRADGEEERTEAAKELSDWYEEIMIDEYQDSNLVQEIILNSICGHEQGRYNIFQVGDVKQSIYRFRLARPELFMEKYDRYTREGGVEHRIDLHKNFRSRDEVLQLSNFLFEQLMQRDLGGVVYDDAAALYPGADYPECPGGTPNSELLLVESGHDEEEIDDSERELEARAVGKRIREIVGHQLIYDRKKESFHPAEYGDIVVLLRTISGWADTFVKIFAEMGIPAFSGSKSGYFSAPEIQTMLALLKLIDNPYQDIPMAAVLSSPIVGLTTEEMARIRIRHPERPFAEACREEEMLTEFWEQLNRLRRKAVYLPVQELLFEIYRVTGYDAYAAAMPGGEQREANLKMLTEKAIAFENSGFSGLYNFIRYIENLHKYEIDYGEAALQGEGEQTVQILSIHKSKGLEFPIVFVSGMGKRFNQSDTIGQMVLHADYGIGADYADPILRIRRQTLLKQMMKRQLQLENLGEELRVLYVALTRAREKLILTGTVKSAEAALERYEKLAKGRAEVLSFSVRSSARTYLDWIVPALLRNRCADHLRQQFALGPASFSTHYEKEIFTELSVVTVRDLITEEKDHQLQTGLTKEVLLAIPQEQIFDEEARAWLNEQLTYRYPFENLQGIPSKVSVSELKRQHLQEADEEAVSLYDAPQETESEETAVPEEDELVPEFLRAETQTTPAARGTIYHKVMECLNYAKIGEESASEILTELVKQNRLTEEEAALVDPKKIDRFLSSSLCGRMKRAAAEGKLYREQQFVIAVPANSLRKEWDSQEEVLIQGIIDAFFLENDRIVLVDYKTDFVKFQEASSLYEKYRVQLESYEYALERLFSLPVKEKLIYSFCLGRVLCG
ncbi:MAG: helicase-exonuclease AddAB subunit AddA [Eubacteriales bacterium]|nr:helicase-exonuclease AddAB subunit AddA [Eubacteriales bacterium]